MDKRKIIFVSWTLSLMLSVSIVLGYGAQSVFAGCSGTCVGDYGVGGVGVSCGNKGCCCCSTSNCGNEHDCPATPACVPKSCPAAGDMCSGTSCDNGCGTTTYGSQCCSSCTRLSGYSTWSQCKDGRRTGSNPIYTTVYCGDCTSAPSIQICGVCGPANGTNVAQAPRVGLCASGMPSSLTRQGNTWTWLCKGSDNTTTAEDAHCMANYRVDGVCDSTSTGTYSASETKYRGALCTTGTVTNVPRFPSYGQTVTWGCMGLGSGTAASCSASRACPQAQCGTSSGVSINTMPSTNLCISPSFLTGNVAFDTNGYWQWDCKMTVWGPATGCNLTTHCQAPSCLVNMPIDLQPYVYFGSDGTPNDAIATVTCPNVCCIINGGNGAVTVCNGDATPGMIPVFPGSHSYPAECWFDNDHDRTNDDIGEPKVSYNPGRTISTMCTAHSCNSQGTCQATPQAANTADSCLSTCNSDADCTRGRMIETRP
jgi:hypothetical protein